LPSHLAKPAELGRGSRDRTPAFAGAGSAADEAYETSALPTELFRAVVIAQSASVLDVARAWMAAPLGFEPSRPSSKPGALPARRRGNALAPRAGFEPAPSDLKDRCPRPLDERGDVGAGSENRTRVFCLEGSGFAIELRPRGGWCRNRTCATSRGLDALATRCITARPTIRDWSPRVNRTPNPPLRRQPLSSAELRGQVVSVGGFEPPISWFQARQGRPDSPTR
jgi:hypothetical protein